MKMIPRKDWQEPAIIAAQDLEFRNKVIEMQRNPAIAKPIDVPPGYFERNAGERTNLMLMFDIDDAEEQKAAAAMKADADKRAAARAAEDDRVEQARVEAAKPKVVPPKQAPFDAPKPTPEPAKG